MKIYPFCYVCPRDWKLFELLVKSWERIGRHETWTAYHDRKEPLTAEQNAFCVTHDIRVRIRRDNFHPWCGWEHAMSKFHGWADMVGDPSLQPDDYCLYVDSDCVFFTDEILKSFDGADFIGFPHSEYKHVESLKRNWSWLSGCFQAAKVSKIHDMINMSEKDRTKAREEMLEYKFSHNEDVVISFLMAKVGATEKRLEGSKFNEPDPTGALNGQLLNPKSFVHLNGNPEWFMGIPITGKWDIPIALEQAGVRW